MIHIYIGTKAQMVKMAPIIRELERRDIEYNYIDSGQHAEITAELAEQFNVPAPDVVLRKKEGNISSLFEALQWSLSNLWRILFRKKDICNRAFRNQRGICLIHGDTLTTLFSLLYAKRCNLQVAHVEAGLRSFNIFDPFPEEIIRLIVMRFSDILFAPSEWAVDNLKKMGYAEKTVAISGNTVVDAVRYAKGQAIPNQLSQKNYVLTTIHRVETIYSRQRLEMIVDLLQRISKTKKVIFVLHEPTRDQLKKNKLLETLREDSGIELLPLQSHLAFIQLISNADFVITDGGSIQEETYYLNKPCLIMRSRTERDEGLNMNAYLAMFDEKRIDQFLNNWQAYHLPEMDDMPSPSKDLVDVLVQSQGIPN